MRCPRCDAQIKDTAALCNFCGQDLSVIHYVQRVSNAYYNMGLERAQVRDLSGAIVILKKSLQFNKKNTDARNLLGLIYYEMGEMVAALSEWVLSKYLQQDDNEADYYINYVQKNQTALDAANQTIKKYNSALAAAKAGNTDLAVIQLKKVVSLNQHFVRAHQLLALLYIHDQDYQKAAKCLNRARRIDFNNTMTLRYMQEVGDKIGSGASKSRDGSGTKKSSKKDSLANVIPVGTYKEEKKSLLPVVYVIIGAIVGIAVSFVLIRPTLQRVGNSGSQLSDTNNQLAVQSSQISGLKKEKEVLEEEKKALEKKIADADSESQKKSQSYEKLLKGINAYLANDKIQAAVEVSDCQKTDFATEEAQELYTKIGAVTEVQINQLVAQGRALMNESYNGAISTFKKVLKLDQNNQSAMYYMAYCYQRKGDNKKAKKWYGKAIQENDTTMLATQAERNLEKVNQALGQDTTTATATPVAE